MEEKSQIKNILSGIVKLVTDLQYFFHKDFIKENYYKHFGVSLPIAFLGMVLGILYFDLDDVGLFFQLFMGWFALFAVNGIREAILHYKFGAPFSWTDVRFGGYGGIVGAYLAQWICG